MRFRPIGYFPKYDITYLCESCVRSSYQPYKCARFDTGIKDIEGNEIFEGDILEYKINGDIICRSIVRYGKYRQDASDGEYCGAECIGIYAKMVVYTVEEWADDDECEPPDYLITDSLLQLFRDYHNETKPKIIGNVWDNPELLKENGWKAVQDNND